MSRQLRAFRDGVARQISSPKIKDGGVWKSASKVYRKELGAWVEWWPLAPDPPTAVTGVFLYRNDRIELDIDFDAPIAGTAADKFRVEVFVGSSVYGFYRDADGVFTPDKAWQVHAGDDCHVSVYGVSVDGNAGVPAVSGQLVVPQLPPPPSPTSVVLTLSNSLRGTLTWTHDGGSRLSHFEIVLSFRGVTYTYTNQSNTKRSADVTKWSTSPVHGDPGGDIAVMIRAVGIGGVSLWANTSGVIPATSLPQPEAPTPPPTPTPTAVLPGTVVITNHRFKNGNLVCDYSAPNAVGVNVWWQKEGGSNVVTTAVNGSSGTSTVLNPWERDEISRYRIIMRGRNAAGDLGAISNGPWARKLPLPYFFKPKAQVSMRGDKAYNDGLLRQGGSYNSTNYKNPVIRWASYVMYNKQALAPSYVGYTVGVTSSAMLVGRDAKGGSGSAVRPRVWLHNYASTGSVGLSLGTSMDGPALARGAGGNVSLPNSWVQDLINPSKPQQGIALYHPNIVLLSWLGEVSAEYVRMLGIGYSYLTVPYWTIMINHDG
jgi:hypothetical protein